MKYLKQIVILIFILTVCNYPVNSFAIRYKSELSDYEVKEILIKRYKFDFDLMRRKKLLPPNRDLRQSLQAFERASKEELKTYFMQLKLYKRYLPNNKRPIPYDPNKSNADAKSMLSQGTNIDNNSSSSIRINNKNNTDDVIKPDKIKVIDTDIKLQIQSGHAGPLTAVAYSQNKEYLFTAGYDASVLMWDVVSGMLVHRFKHYGPVDKLVITTDNKFLIVAGQSPFIYVWNIESRELYHRFDALKIASDGGKIQETGHGFTAWDVDVSQNGDFIVSAGKKHIALWDFRNKKLIRQFDGGRISKFINNDTEILGAGGDGQVKVWSVNGDEIKNYPYFFGDPNKNATAVRKYLIKAIINEKKGYVILAGKLLGQFDGVYDESVVYAVEIKSGKLISKMQGHSNIIDITMLSDDKLASLDSALWIWDINTGSKLKTISSMSVLEKESDSDSKIPIDSGVWSALTAIVLDDELIYSTREGKLINVNVETSTYREFNTGNVNKFNHLEFISGDKYLALSNNNHRKLINIQKGIIEKVDKNISDYNYYQYEQIWRTKSPNGKIIAELTKRLTNNVRDNEFVLKCTNLISETEVCNINLTKSTLGLFKFSPNGRHLVLADFEALNGKQYTWVKNKQKDKVIRSNNLQVYDLISKKMSVLSGHNMNVTSLEFSKSGRYLFSGSLDKDIQVLDLNNNKLVRTLKGHQTAIISLAVSKDGTNLASLSDDGHVAIWDIPTATNLVNYIMVGENSEPLIFTQDFYYHAAKNTDTRNAIAFVYKNKAYPFSQFDLKFNRPDIISSKLRNPDEDAIASHYKAYKKRLSYYDMKESDLKLSFDLPKVKILNKEKIPQITKERKVDLVVGYDGYNQMLDKTNVTVNGVPLFVRPGSHLSNDSSNEKIQKISVPLSKGKNKIQISVVNKVGVESLKESVNVRGLHTDTGRTFIFALGVSDYSDNKIPKLRYPGKDAEDIVKLFSNKSSKVEAKSFVDSQVTRDLLLRIKKQLLNTKVDDQVIIFYAGHGKTDDDGNLYLLTHDTSFSDPKKNSIPYEEIESLLDNIPARNKLLLIDACNAGELDKETINNSKSQNIFMGESPQLRTMQTDNVIQTKSTSVPFKLMKTLFSDLRTGTGANVIVSSAGDEFAYETEELENGIFTYSLLNGVDSMGADLDKDGNIRVSEISQYLQNEVNHQLDVLYSEKNLKQTPSLRSENINNDFTLWSKSVEGNAVIR